MRCDAAVRWVSHMGDGDQADGLGLARPALPGSPTTLINTAAHSLDRSLPYAAPAPQPAVHIVTTVCIPAAIAR